MKKYFKKVSLILVLILLLGVVAPSDFDKKKSDAFAISLPVAGLIFISSAVAAGAIYYNADHAINAYENFKNTDAYPRWLANIQKYHTAAVTNAKVISMGELSRIINSGHGIRTENLSSNAISGLPASIKASIDTSYSFDGLWQSVDVTSWEPQFLTIGGAKFAINPTPWTYVSGSSTDYGHSRKKININNINSSSYISDLINQTPWDLEILGSSKVLTYRNIGSDYMQDSIWENNRDIITSDGSIRWTAQDWFRSNSSSWISDYFNYLRIFQNNGDLFKYYGDGTFAESIRNIMVSDYQIISEGVMKISLNVTKDFVIRFNDTLTFDDRTSIYDFYVYDSGGIEGLGPISLDFYTSGGYPVVAYPVHTVQNLGFRGGEQKDIVDYLGTNEFTYDSVFNNIDNLTIEDLYGYDYGSTVGVVHPIQHFDEVVIHDVGSIGAIDDVNHTVSYDYATDYINDILIYDSTPVDDLTPVPVPVSPSVPYIPTNVVSLPDKYIVDVSVDDFVSDYEFPKRIPDVISEPYNPPDIYVPERRIPGIDYPLPDEVGSIDDVPAIEKPENVGEMTDEELEDWYGDWLDNIEKEWAEWKEEIDIQTYEPQNDPDFDEEKKYPMSPKDYGPILTSIYNLVMDIINWFKNIFNKLSDIYNKLVEMLEVIKGRSLETIHHLMYDIKFAIQDISFPEIPNPLNALNVIGNKISSLENWLNLNVGKVIDWFPDINLSLPEIPNPIPSIQAIPSKIYNVLSELEIGRNISNLEYSLNQGIDSIIKKLNIPDYTVKLQNIIDAIANKSFETYTEVKSLYDDFSFKELVKNIGTSFTSSIEKLGNDITTVISTSTRTITMSYEYIVKSIKTAIESAINVLVEGIQYLFYPDFKEIQLEIDKLRDNFSLKISFITEPAEIIKNIFVNPKSIHDVEFEILGYKINLFPRIYESELLFLRSMFGGISILATLIAIFRRFMPDKAVDD